jgi:hypothetical protein
VTDAPPGVDDTEDQEEHAAAEAEDREEHAAAEAEEPVADETARAEPAPPPPIREAAPTDEPLVVPAMRVDDTESAPAGPRLVTAEEVMNRRQRKRATRLRARKVKRIVRRFDAWSVLKVSFIFYLCVYVVSMVSAVILWNVAAGAGVIDNLESFIEDLGAFETFEFVPDKLLKGTLLGGAVLTVLATGLTALGSVLFNLISDLVGGIRLTVIEEPGARPMLRPRKAAKVAAKSSRPARPAADSDPPWVSPPPVG